MALPLRKGADRKFTWSDYLTWPDEERWEVIDGVAYNMTPSPTSRHQMLAGNFYRILANRLSGHRCRVFIAPLDVYFDDTNFVQPDVLVVCDEKKIKDRIYGAPDSVLEVLSPRTSLKDKREKRSLYERFGVKEYIIIDPLEEYVERFYLADGGIYGKGEVFGPLEVLPLRALEGVTVNLWEVFEVAGPEEKVESEG
jgi:Uma2 family endonuclease